MKEKDNARKENENENEKRELRGERVSNKRNWVWEAKLLNLIMMNVKYKYGRKKKKGKNFERKLNFRRTLT